MMTRSLTTLVLTGMLAGLLSGSVAAQNLSDLHRITNGISGSHMESGGAARQASATALCRAHRSLSGSRV